MTEDEHNGRVDSGDGRATVKKGQASRFKTGDTVYFDPGGNSPLEGPYLISSVPSPQHYILCNPTDYSLINSGEVIKESKLVKG